MNNLQEAFQEKSLRRLVDELQEVDEINDAEVHQLLLMTISQNFEPGFQYLFRQYQPQKHLEELLFSAIKHSNFSVVKKLITLDINFLATTAKSQNILHLATMYCNFEMMAYLLKNLSPDTSRYLSNTFDAGGNTPLHIASNEMQFALLISYGADLTMVNNNGICFLDMLPQDLNQVLGILKHFDASEQKIWLKAYSRAYFESYQKEPNKQSHMQIALDLASRLSLDELIKFKLKLTQPELETIDLNTVAKSEHGFFAHQHVLIAPAHQTTNAFKKALLHAMSVCSNEKKRLQSNQDKLSYCDLPALILSPFMLCVVPEYAARLWLQAGNGLEQDVLPDQNHPLKNLRQTLKPLLHHQSNTSLNDEVIQQELEQLDATINDLTEHDDYQLEDLDATYRALSNVLGRLNETNWPTVISSPLNSEEVSPDCYKLQMNSAG